VLGASGENGKIEHSGAARTMLKCSKQSFDGKPGGKGFSAFHTQAACTFMAA